MFTNPLTCPHCLSEISGQDQFCPVCKLRLTHLSVSKSDESITSLKGQARNKELSMIAAVTARLAGASLLWPLIAAFLTLYQGAGAKAFIAVVMGIIPCLAGLGAFFIASNCFRAELKSKGDGLNLIVGVMFTLAGLAVWYYGVLFFLNFQL